MATTTTTECRHTACFLDECELYISRDGEGESHNLGHRLCVYILLLSQLILRLDLSAHFGLQQQMKKGLEWSSPDVNILFCRRVLSLHLNRAITPVDKVCPPHKQRSFNCNLVLLSKTSNQSHMITAMLQDIFILLLRARRRGSSLKTL